MAKRRNPQDSTLRNVRASRKREATLRERVKTLEAKVEVIERWLEKDGAQK